MKLTSLIAQETAGRGAPFPDPDYGLLQLPGTGGTAPRRDPGKLPAVGRVIIVPTGGVSTVYANDGGIIVAYAAV